MLNTGNAVPLDEKTTIQLQDTLSKFLFECGSETAKRDINRMFSCLTGSDFFKEMDPVDRENIFASYCNIIDLIDGLGKLKQSLLPPASSETIRPSQPIESEVHN